MMPIEQIPDWEKRIARHDAFWSREVIDRPPVLLHTYRHDSGQAQLPRKSYPDVRDRWLDVEHLLRAARSTVAGFDYRGDALPVVWPNLGPDVFSAFLGCELRFGESTSWSVPLIEDWADVDRVRFSENNIYWKKINEMMDALIAEGQGCFYTGLTDLHPGGDAVAALRGPERLALDMVESPDEVRRLVSRINSIYADVLRLSFGKLASSDLPMTGIAPIVCGKRWGFVSNDFSCMISTDMFSEIFVPGIVEECRLLEASVYHLDGPGALRHLDTILDIEELDAVQWVYGPGDCCSNWIDVYRRCQSAGKGVLLCPRVDELETIIEHLRPEGTMMFIYEDLDQDETDAVIRRVSAWR